MRDYLQGLPDAPVKTKKEFDSEINNMEHEL